MEWLWLTEPRRRTCLSTVVAVHGEWFILDRNLFAPTRFTYRHPQPHDTGVVWIDAGEKRKVVNVRLRDGQVQVKVRGTVPPVGARLNCQLDDDRRQSVSRTHTAMHVFLKTWWAAGGPALRADPSVKLGGRFRLDLAAPPPHPNVLARIVAQTNDTLALPIRIATEHVLRQGTPLDAQKFRPDAAYPGPSDAVQVVRIPGVATYPCDGTHADQLSDVGRIAIASLTQSRAGWTVVVRLV